MITDFFFISLFLGISQENSAVFLQYPWIQCMEGKPAQPQILENQILQRFVINPCVVVKMTSKPPFIPGQSHGYSLVFHYNAISNRLSFFVAFIHPGLGTSTSQEAKEYFSDMQRHRVPFKYSGPEDDEAITLVRSYHLFGSFLSQCDLHQFKLKFLKIVYAISEFLTML